MKITDEAKILLVEALVTNDCDCLQVTLKQSCCGTSLDFKLVKSDANDKTVSINGVSVLMDNEATIRTESITLAAEGNELIIEGDAPSCCG